MGEYPFDEDCEFILPRTLVLVGKTGNGKSATGNTILGMQMFRSKRSPSSVTRTSELKTLLLEDGQGLNVIDTPGLFDSSLDFKFIGKEIVSCIHKAKDGIDAFLFVISVHSRFTGDEHAAISSLLTLFGSKFYDYMIIVFTGGDELEQDNQSLEEFLCESPKALQETLHLCDNRCVLFDNSTNDPTKRSDQVQKLLSLVDMVSKNNGGKPYTNEIFTELKKLTKELDEQEISACDNQFKGIYEMVEAKLKETAVKFEKLLEEERNSRQKTEDEVERLREKLEEANKREEENKKREEEDRKTREEEHRKREEEFKKREEEHKKKEEEYKKMEKEHRKRREEENKKKEEEYRYRKVNQEHWKRWEEEHRKKIEKKSCTIL